ncbi:hypothetical protein SCLO_1003010 [Sphingobium cloacae]|uniref:Cytochrome c n=1 Tax=Sphingobium cloacae TaxID=120107 RepID=A0A1E1EYN2_9SPHN|nr:hypothetical protein SCLO_1003010 [Sphingobium cloacae]
MEVREVAAGILLGAAMLSMTGCHRPPTASSRRSTADQTLPPFKAVASIKELMDSTVDPSADGVWDSVGVIVNEAGTENRQPHSDAEWHEVRRHAVSLVESMNLVMIEGRHAAPPNSKAGLGELTPQQIEAAIAANRPEFNQFAAAVRDSGIEAIDAIDRKDVKALTRVGGDIDQRCEACHVTFWYPDSQRPGA